MNLEGLTDLELLRLHSSILVELRKRSVCRTNNNPVADYAERLVAEGLGLKLVHNAHAGFDALGPDGTRYQIKGRRRTVQNRSTQLGAVRNLQNHDFDFLIGVMFNDDFSVEYAFQIPHAIVLSLARHQAHTNSHRFLLRRTLSDYPDVRDVTQQISPS